MISKYIENERSTILAVLPARCDIEADPSLELIKKYDPNGDRTIGIFTKIDLMNIGTDVSDYINDNISKDLKFKYGYYAVKNRGTTMLDNTSVLEGINLEKKYFKNIKAYIFSKKKNFFIKKFRNKIYFQTFNSLEKNLKKILEDIKKNKITNPTVLFSPAAASFDQFDNFEDRGKYFNKLIKKYIYAR